MRRRTGRSLPDPCPAAPNRSGDGAPAPVHGSLGSTVLVDGPRLLGQAGRHAGSGSRADRARLPGGGPRGGAPARRAPSLARPAAGRHRRAARAGHLLLPAPHLRRAERRPHHRREPFLAPLTPAPRFTRFFGHLAAATRSCLRPPQPLPSAGPMPGPSDPSPPWAPTPEVRRRRREGGIIAGIIVAVVLLAIAQFRLPQSLGSGSLGTDAMLIGLINVNLILLVLLVFLVGRNIAKLVFERRARIMGSHLRTRLVVAFVAIALLPATLLFLVGLVFVGNSIERWFNGQVERSLEGALEVAHDYYQDLAGTALGFARELAQQVKQQGFLARPPRRAQALPRRAARRVPARSGRGLR